MGRGVAARHGIAALVALMVLSFGTVTDVRAEGSGAGIGPVEWVVALEGGMGVPGGTVGVTVTLDGPSEPPKNLFVTIIYPPDDLELAGSVDDSCMLSDRLADSHVIFVEQMDDGKLDVAVGPDGEGSLGEGNVFDCYFTIPVGVPSGTVAVMLDDVRLEDQEELELPVQTRDGEVLITDDMPDPTPTFTATAAPPPPTATEEVPPTSTPTVDPDATATQVPPPTATNTTRPLPTQPGGDSDDSCAIVPVKDSDPLASLLLLLVPAVLLWGRRRSF